MSILKRGDQKYLVRISLGKDSVTGKRLYHTETVRGTKKEAESRDRALLREFEQGTLVQRSTKSLNEFMLQWLASAKARVRGRTHEGYAGLWERYLKADLGRLPLDKITPLRVQQVYNEMTERGLSPLTVRKLHTVLHQALKQAVRWRMLGANPAGDIDLPARRTKKVIRALAQDQALAFLEATRAFRLGAALRLALHSGMRPEEYFALQWPDIDFERGAARVERVLVRPKGGGWIFEEPKTAGSRRNVSLDVRVLAELKAHRVDQLESRMLAGPAWDCSHDFVFTNERGGPLDISNLTTQAFKPALRAADLPSTFRLYDLRHTHATLLLLAGEHAKIVSERLGHSSVAITLDTYSHVLPSMQADSARRAADLLFPTRLRSV